MYYTEKHRELVVSSVTEEFLTLAKDLLQKKKQNGYYYEIEWYTLDCGFYIIFQNKYKSCSAIGKKTHPEQNIFTTKEEAQKQGCKEFIEWYKEKFKNT